MTKVNFIIPYIKEESCDVLPRVDGIMDYYLGNFMSYKPQVVIDMVEKFKSVNFILQISPYDISEGMYDNIHSFVEKMCSYNNVVGFYLEEYYSIKKHVYPKLTYEKMQKTIFIIKACTTKLIYMSDYKVHEWLLPWWIQYWNDFKPMKKLGVDVCLDSQYVQTFSTLKSKIILLQLWRFLNKKIKYSIIIPTHSLKIVSELENKGFELTQKKIDEVYELYSGTVPTVEWINKYYKFISKFNSLSNEVWFYMDILSYPYKHYILDKINKIRNHVI